MKHFPKILKITLLLGAAALAGCHGKPHVVVLTPPLPPCEYGSRSPDGICRCPSDQEPVNGSCMPVCIHGDRLPDDSCPPEPCPNGEERVNGSCMCNGIVRNGRCEPLPDGPLSQIPHIMDYIERNPGTVGDAFEDAANNPENINTGGLDGNGNGNPTGDGGTTQSSDGVSRVGIDDFRSISVDSNGNLGEIEIRNYAYDPNENAPSWSVINSFSTLQMTVTGGGMALRTKTGAENTETGIVYMDVYTNIQVKNNRDTTERGLANAIAFIDGNNVVYGVGDVFVTDDGVRNGRAEYDGRMGTWSCAGDCMLSFTSTSLIDYTVASVENYLFTPDGESEAMTVTAGVEFEFWTEEDIFLIRRDGSEEEAIAGSLGCDRDANGRISTQGLIWRCHWESAGDEILVPRILGRNDVYLTPAHDGGMLQTGLPNTRMYSNGVQFTPDGTATGDADYLVGGVWVHIPDDGDPEGFEVGAFADGSAKLIFPAPNGTATYSGAAAGLAYGGGQLAEFKANATLNANFGTNTISGALTEFEAVNATLAGTLMTIMGGTVGDINLQEASFSTTPTDANYGIFNDDTSVVVGSDTWTGQWGGQFYGVNAHSAAGTFGATNGATNSEDKRSIVGFFLTEQ